VVYLIVGLLQFFFKLYGIYDKKVFTRQHDQDIVLLRSLWVLHVLVLKSTIIIMSTKVTEEAELIGFINFKGKFHFIFLECLRMQALQKECQK
jgi:hypothetical protein